jgi:hypothetical protein
VNTLCKRAELKFKDDGRYNKLIRESSLQEYLNKGHGFHRRQVKKRLVDHAKELAKAQAQLLILQGKVDAMKREGLALNKLRERWCQMVPVMKVFRVLPASSSSLPPQATRETN